MAALPLHCTALFLGAFLLFAIQPMFTKMILPLLGGTPAVWNTAVMFFQAMLLAGYLYAHLLSRLPGLRRQVMVHGVVLAAGLVSLPVHLAWPAGPSGGTHPVAWLTALLAVSLGLPFFAVSATAPLLQRWFSRSGHVHASDPYFLYVSSNVGGLAALLAYPVVIEPRLGLALQSRIWTAGYLLLAVTIVLCSVSLRTLRGVPAGADAGPRPAGPVTWDRRAQWLVLSFVPSALLLAVTLHISTDVASMPFLWVAPLALYLLSFVVVFARRPVLRHKWMLIIQIPLYALLPFYFAAEDLWLVLGLHLLVLFVTALVCHGELVRRRPAAEHLTEFYLWMSLGGLLGGIFCALVAPALFNSVLEYPLLLICACLLRPESGGGQWRRRLLDVILPALFALAYSLAQSHLDLGAAGPPLLYLAVVAVLFAFRNRPLRLTLAFAPLLLGSILPNEVDHRLFRARSFFGVYTVCADAGEGKHELIHGGILHGDQYLDEATLCTPTTYFDREGPLGQVFAALRAARTVRHVGCVGLGAGTMACYQQPGQRLTFFEVDPVVERIARDPRLFRYLELCGQDVDVVLGDGRQSLGRMPDGTFDLLVLDAFSSDAIPIHLLTREAVALYLRKLAPGGILLLHLSNRYMNLEPVVANLAAEAGLHALIQDYEPDEVQSEAGAFSSTWAALAPDDEARAPLEADDRWRSAEADPRVGIWTDDYSNVFRILIWGTWFDQ